MYNNESILKTVFKKAPSSKLMLEPGMQALDAKVLNITLWQYWLHFSDIDQSIYTCAHNCRLYGTPGGQMNSISN